MRTNCDNCTQSSDILHEAILLPASGSGGTRENFGSSLEQDPFSTSSRLTISDALTAICCTLWGEAVTTPTTTESDPDPLGVPFKEELELCSTCTESLTLLYNTLLEFRSLCAEKGRVFDRLLELRKIRRKQETVVAVVKLERLPPSPTPRRQRSFRQRSQRPKYVDEDDDGSSEDGISSNVEILNKLEVEIKEEPCSDDDDLGDDPHDYNFVPDDADPADFSDGEAAAFSNDADSDSDDEDFVIRPSKGPSRKQGSSHHGSDHSSTSSSHPDKVRPRRSYGNGNFECHICHQRFLYFSGRSRHIREKHGEGPTRFPCPLEDCDKAYSRREEVRNHLKKMHPTANVSLNFERKRRSPNRDPTSRQNNLDVDLSTSTRLPCPLEDCDKTYARREDLKKHLKKMHPTAEVSLARKQRSSDHDTESDHSSTNFECHICHQKFLHFSGRSRHIREQHGEGPTRFPCPIEDCDKAYSRREEVRNHLKKMHPTANISLNFKRRSPNRDPTSRQKDEDLSTRLPCLLENCDKTYARREDLIKHLKKIHPTADVTLARKQRSQNRDPKPRKERRDKPKKPCPQCGKMFRSDHLAEHIRTHSNERPFLCDLCGGTYKTKRFLRIHVQEVHTKEKAFHCPHPPCTVTCSRPFSLKRHIQSVHQINWDPFTCEVCGKHFVHEKNLRGHQKLHDADGSKQLECSICNKFFSRVDNLRNHVKTVHEGRKLVTKKKGTPGPSRNTAAKCMRQSEQGLQEQEQGQRQESYQQQEQEQDNHNDDHDQESGSYQRTKNFFFH